MPKKEASHRPQDEFKKAETAVLEHISNKQTKTKEKHIMDKTIFKKAKTILGYIGWAIIFTAAIFFAGMKFQESQTSAQKAAVKAEAAAIVKDVTAKQELATAPVSK